MTDNSKNLRGLYRILPATLLICTAAILVLTQFSASSNAYSTSDSGKEYGAAAETTESGSAVSILKADTVSVEGKPDAEFDDSGATVRLFGSITPLLGSRVFNRGMEPQTADNTVDSLASETPNAKPSHISGLAMTLSSAIETAAANYQDASLALSESLNGQDTIKMRVVAERHNCPVPAEKYKSDEETAACLSYGTYEPIRDPDAAPDYGTHITSFGDEGNYTGEQIWFFEDNDGTITTATGEVIAYNGILHVSATAYTTEETRNRITATGTVARMGTVAVDPRVIPYGTSMYIVSEYGNWVYGYGKAEDCGGGIKDNKIDLFFETVYECFQFGVRDAQIYILADGK